MLSKDYADNKCMPKDSGIRAWYLIDYAIYPWHYLNLCCQVKLERRALAKLTLVELQDIGLHPADIRAECKRSFFDVPKDRWHRYIEAKNSKPESREIR